MKSYFLITTQNLENYGAHCESGKFSDGTACWKFKGGETYIVSYTTSFGREANAVAFMTAYLHKRNARLESKEIVTGWKQIHQGETPPQIDLLEEYGDYTSIDIDSYFKGADYYTYRNELAV